MSPPGANAHSHRRLPTAFQLMTAVSLLTLCAAWAASGTAQSAEKEEREVQDKIPAHLPIKVKVKNPEKANKLDNDGWLADLEIEVKNTGNKPIYYLSFFLEFVDVKKDSGGTIGYEFQYGRTKLIEIDQRPTPEDVPLLPGETHVFKLHQDYVDGWNWYRTQVEHKPQPKKVEFIFSALTFGDGTGYMTNGGVFVPTQPRKKSSYEGGPQGGGGAVTAASGCRPARAPDPAFKLASYFLPAAFSPASFFTARVAFSSEFSDERNLVDRLKRKEYKPTH